MKSLKPSMRENKRYLLVRLSQARSDLPKSQTKGRNLRENIEKAILEFVGVLGMSKAGLSFIKSGKDSVIISINREAINEVRASLCVFSEEMKVVKVSGTLKGLGR